MFLLFVVYNNTYKLGFVVYIMAEYVKYEEEGPRRVRNRIYRIGRYSFSRTEVVHLAVAYVMISLTLFVHNMKIFDVDNIYQFMIVNFFTIGFGFLFHEMGHKFTAQYYGFISEFRADFMMLGIMFVFALFSPVILLAPGAVMILGRLSMKQNGIVSVAGPLVNLTLAFIYSVIAYIFMPSMGSLFGQILLIGIYINAFLGIFNMLPFWVLDGKKVLAWNWKIYLVTMSGLIFFLFLAMSNVLFTL